MQKKPKTKLEDYLTITESFMNRHWEILEKDKCCFPLRFLVELFYNVLKYKIKSLLNMNCDEFERMKNPRKL